MSYISPTAPLGPDAVSLPVATAPTGVSPAGWQRAHLVGPALEMAIGLATSALLSLLICTIAAAALL